MIQAGTKFSWENYILTSRSLSMEQEILLLFSAAGWFLIGEDSTYKDIFSITGT